MLYGPFFMLLSFITYHRDNSYSSLLMLSAIRSASAEIVNEGLTPNPVGFASAFKAECAIPLCPIYPRILRNFLST